MATKPELNIAEYGKDISSVQYNDNFDKLNDYIEAISEELMLKVNTINSQLSSNVLSNLQSIYPVGSLYIGTTDTCPIANLFGTWEKIEEGLCLQSVKGDQVAGTTVEAGLPNITAKMMGTTYGGLADEYVNASGACRTEGNGGASAKGGTELYLWKHDFDASRSSAIYGKSSTVTPASTTLYPWVVAYTAAIPASTAQAAEFQQGLSGKADTNLGNIPSNYDYVVESYNDGTNWYRKYKSGWVEQGGYYTGGNQTKTLLVPMANTNYTCLSACGVKEGVNWNGNPITIYRNSTTYISLNTYGDYPNCTGWWEVKGQAAS